MNDFSVIDGVAQIHDPALYETWLDREDYKAAVAQADTPERTAIKRLLVEFEADLGRMVRDDTVQENVVDVMKRYVVEDYIQHDPNAPGHGLDNLIEHFRRVPIGRGTPPPVVSVVLDGDLGTVMMKMPMPDPVSPGETYDWYMITLFRVRDGKLAEHWSTFQKMAAPLLPENS
ncbi:nuclear transport factor 2 family protein [Nocardia miyunensis]|uniref:nuclear transport factor 2 family protein n=1 Tax=Nocardia miyunensis TaxID=282684 RepID=UPI00082EC71A|nr:nuclear transport factor 2 family protein [Nocardia miyunensis]